MYDAYITNHLDETIKLNNRENEWQVISIDGLHPVQAQINMNRLAGHDGALFNSGSILTRNIVVILKINGDADENRMTLERFFTPKQPVRFYYKTTKRDVFADGYVESFDYGLFDQMEVAQASIICPSPYFLGKVDHSVEITNIVRRFYFPFVINFNDPIPVSERIERRIATLYNSTMVESGLKIKAEVLDPCSLVEVTNMNTEEFVGIEYSFLSGDVIEIDTDPLVLSAKLIRNGKSRNMFPYLTTGSILFELHPGENTYTCRVMNGNEELETGATVTLSYRDHYLGV